METVAFTQPLDAEDYEDFGHATQDPSEYELLHYDNNFLLPRRKTRDLA
jgi:hypothetical protein